MLAYLNTSASDEKLSRCEFSQPARICVWQCLAGITACDFDAAETSSRSAAIQSVLLPRYRAVNGSYARAQELRALEMTVGPPSGTGIFFSTASWFHLVYIEGPHRI